jgi:N-formylglutamate deformylase
MTPFDLVRPEAGAIPLLVDSPHSGTDYPDDFRPAAPRELLAQAEDSHVDRLAASAPRHGATFLAARFPRSYIDVNRALDDIDPALLDGTWPTPLNPGEKTDLGIGLIRKVATPGVPVYDRRLPVAEVQARIDRFYRPYHDALAAELDRLHAAFGEVVYIDWHSMKSVGNSATPDPGRRRPDVVLGDRRGTACAGALTDLVAAAFRSRGYSVAVNDPYQGARLVILHGRPAEGRHALQVELNRALYMDEATREPHDGFGRLAEAVDGAIAEAAAWVRARVASGRH